MKTYKSITQEEFEALSEEEQIMTINETIRAGMIDDDRARMKWYDGAMERAEKWDKTMQDVFGKPKKKARGIFLITVLITILTAAALALLVANG